VNACVSAQGIEVKEEPLAVARVRHRVAVVQLQPRHLADHFEVDQQRRVVRLKGVARLNGDIVKALLKQSVCSFSSRVFPFHS